MNSSKVLVSKRILAFGFSNLVKCRGMSRLDDLYYKPGSMKDRTFKRTWAEQQVEQPEVGERLDDTKYNPGRWTEREYQATWQEPVYEDPQEEVEDSRSQKEPSPAPVLRRSFDPNRRLQRIAIPASQFISQFISTQSKNKRRYIEAAGDRMAFDGYQLA
ncbi:uncharacterized protein LOC119551815 [Drosophila subpulchrella]|uniref:uncharacterized protein LOC119551815 n=1 Tax=Drosophila subpulchrella TaxID=1486046 RepID=UPI0018A13FFC|nr:uncharacterized protein LOC119551815 [Drosophila subpulchrella]